MKTEYEEAKTDTPCPSCNSEALYRYGKAGKGKQRFICIMCGKQFTNGSKVSEVTGKPLCQECGKPMNVYKIEGDLIRFRCSGYPDCKHFRKFRMKEDDKEQPGC